MAIRAVVGEPGTGKSYFAVHKALEQWATGYKRAKERHNKIERGSDWRSRMPDVKSYKGLAANFDFDKPAVARYLRIVHRLGHHEAVVLASQIQAIKSLQGLLDLWNCIAIFDEAQLWFNARDFAYFPTEVLSMWTQHRKAGLDIIICTQAFSMIDSNIRNVTADVLRARPLPWTVRLYRKMMGAKYPTFRYISIKMADEGEKAEKVKGFGESIDRIESVTLNPLVAACYQTTGAFYAPSSEIHAALGTQKAKLAEKLGLKYDLSRFIENTKTSARSVDMPLPFEDYAAALIAGVPVHGLVGQFQAAAYRRQAGAAVGNVLQSETEKSAQPVGAGERSRVRFGASRRKISTRFGDVDNVQTEDR